MLRPRARGALEGRAIQGSQALPSSGFWEAEAADNSVKVCVCKDFNLGHADCSQQRYCSSVFGRIRILSTRCLKAVAPESAPLRGSNSFVSAMWRDAAFPASYGALPRT